MATQRITAVALSVLVVALTGCGSHVIDRVVEQSPEEGTTTTVTTPGASTTVVSTPGPMGTQSPVEAAPPTVALPAVESTAPGVIDGLDPMLDEIDQALAELDQLFNDAAAALAAEEGVFIP